MIFQSLGGAKLIGANSHFLNIDDIGILLDTGLDPRVDGQGSLPGHDSLIGRMIDALFVSHCHLDHLGALPPTIKRFPHARVFMSYVSSFLYTTMLHNTVNVMEHLRLEKSIDEYPLYSHEDVDLISFIVQGMKFFKAFRVFGHHNPDRGIECAWYPAGHTLGAGGLYINAKEGRVFYTGDTCARDQFLIKGADYPDDPVDILITENTLGHEKQSFKRRSEVQRLTRILNETFESKGSVLIPAFALGKTQEMLWLINDLKKKKTIPDVSVFVSGLGRAVARIYDLTVEHANRLHENFFFDETEFTVLDSRDLMREGPWLKRPSVILASSGMMLENTPSYFLACRMMREARHTICFAGYVSPDSPANVVKHSVQGGETILPGLDDRLHRQCRIEQVHFTGHSTRHDILGMIKQLFPKKIVLVHNGSEEAAWWMKSQISEWDPAIEVIVPEIGVSYDL